MKTGQSSLRWGTIAPSHQLIKKDGCRYLYSTKGRLGVVNSETQQLRWVTLRSNATCYNGGNLRNAVAPQPTLATLARYFRLGKYQWTFTQ